MRSVLKPNILRSRGQNTRRNLPMAVSRKRGESNFLRAFEKAYFGNEVRNGVAGREFALEGFGRADLIWMAWTRGNGGGDFTALELRKKIRLTAVEAKLTDWRKGLHQAYRYRYFADRSLLVVPRALSATITDYLPTFRRLRIGIWCFDSTTGRIQKLFTPRCSPPLSRVARERALEFLQRSFKPLLASQTKRVRRGSRRYAAHSNGHVK